MYSLSSGGADLSALAAGKIALTEGVYEIFFKELEEAESQAFNVFKQKKTTKREEYLIEWHGLTTAEQRTILGAQEFQSPLDGNKKRTEILDWSRAVQFAEEDIEDELYDLLGQVAKDLPNTHRRRVELLCAAVVAGIFSTTTGFDGLPICSTAHTYTAGREDIVSGATTWSNRLAVDSALSPESLASLHLLLRKTRDRDGVPAGLHGDTLIGGVDLEATAFEIMKSVKAAYTDTNEANIHSSDHGLWPTRWQSLEYLPNSTMYALIDKKRSPFYFFWRRKPQVRRQTDMNVGALQFYSNSRFNADAAEPRGLASTRERNHNRGASAPRFHVEVRNAQEH